MKKNNVITSDDWQAALNDLRGAAITNDPDVLTSVELGVLWKCSAATARRHARNLVIAGKAVRMKKYIPHGNDGTYCPVSAYKLVKAKK